MWEQVLGHRGAFDPQGQEGPRGWETSGVVSLLMEKRVVGGPQHGTPLKTGLVCRGREPARATKEMRSNASLPADSKTSMNMPQWHQR